MRYGDDGFRKYEIVEPGYKYNMTDLQAAIGLRQMERIDESLARRRDIWFAYDNALSELPIDAPPTPAPGTRHAMHLYSVRIDPAKVGVTRDVFQNALHRENIGSGIHYVSVHLHEYYRRTFGFRPEDFPNATRLSDETLSLPLSSKVTDADVDDVIGALRKLCAAFAGRGGAKA